MAGKSHAERLPPRVLPLLYLGFAHICLALAFVVLAIAPEQVSGFYYHPKMVAVVHLVTLGWISSSILGALYLVGPIAMRMPIPARWPDHAAFVSFAVGVVGMASHFWIDRYSGMVWSAALVWLAILWVSGRVLSGLRRARVATAVKLHLILAFVNILAAGVLGGLIGLEKLMLQVLPGFVLNNVYAHAHLAAVGWATMMVMGTGYRLFPMVLPAAMPKGRSLYLSAVLLEIGLLGLLVSWPARSVWVQPFAVVTAAGVAVFMGHVAWMRRHPKPVPKEMRRPDFGALQSMLALASLSVCLVLGLLLAFTQPAAWTPKVAMAYGVLGLVGFLAQLVVGMSTRLLPMFAWMHAYVGSDFERVPVSPHRMIDRRSHALTVMLWGLGVPLLTLALATDHRQLVAVSAWMLLGGVLLSGLNGSQAIRHAFARERPPASPEG